MTAESTFAHSSGRDARIVMRGALWASLATFDRQTGYPYVSLIAVAAAVSGEPLFLISTLARHTQNLEFDARASIMFSAMGAGPDPLESPRLSVMGRASLCLSSTARARFLARHPETAEYAGFSDFALWRLSAEVGHYVGGFGRIHSVPAHELRLEGPDVEAFAADQPQYIELLDKRSDLVQKLANQRLADKLGTWGVGGISGKPWRVSGVDPEGCDFVRDRQAVRMDFNNRLQNLQELTGLLEKIAIGL